MGEIGDMSFNNRRELLQFLLNGRLVASTITGHVYRLSDDCLMVVVVRRGIGNSRDYILQDFISRFDHLRDWVGE